MSPLLFSLLDRFFDNLRDTRALPLRENAICPRLISNFRNDPWSNLRRWTIDKKRRQTQSLLRVGFRKREAGLQDGGDAPFLFLKGAFQETIHDDRRFDARHACQFVDQ